MAKNGKVGGSSISLRTWVHERSTMVNAKLMMMLFVVVMVVVAVLDTPGGLRPTGGGKPDGLGCGNLQVKKKTLQFIQITLTTGQMWQNKDACTMGKKPVGCLDFLKNSKTEVLCWTLLVDFVQPVEENQVV